MEICTEAWSLALMMRFVAEHLRGTYLRKERKVREEGFWGGGGGSERGSLSQDGGERARFVIFRMEEALPYAPGFWGEKKRGYG